MTGEGVYVEMRESVHCGAPESHWSTRVPGFATLGRLPFQRAKRSTNTAGRQGVGTMGKEYGGTEMEADQWHVGSARVETKENTCHVGICHQQVTYNIRR